MRMNWLRLYFKRKKHKTRFMFELSRYYLQRTRLKSTLLLRLERLGLAAAHLTVSDQELVMDPKTSPSVRLEIAAQFMELTLSFIENCIEQGDTAGAECLLDEIYESDASLLRFAISTARYADIPFEKYLSDYSWGKLYA